MSETSDASMATASMFDSWMKSVNDFWSNIADTVPQTDSPDTVNENDNTAKNVPGADVFWKTGFETWQSIASAMSRSIPHPMPLTSSFTDSGSFQQMFLEMTQPVILNITRMFQQWHNQKSESAQHINPPDFESLDTDILKIWKNMYDNEFRKFFNMPQLGLTREHQEKITRFMDRFNILQSRMAEFLSLLATPFKKTHTGFQEKLTELAQKKKFPEDVNAFYRIWLKILEGHYMTLFQSTEYVHLLGKTLSASAAYTRAKKDLTNDLLQQFSIPSSEHLDGVYEELYDLKKRIKILEKALANR